MVTLQGYDLKDRLRHLWLPDTFVTNAVHTSTHPSPQPQQCIKVHFDGQVEHKVRLSISASCPMDLRFFPFDNQKCTLSFQSYSFPWSQLKYSWTENNPLIFLDRAEDRRLLLPEVGKSNAADKSIKIRNLFQVTLISYDLTQRNVTVEGVSKSQLDLTLYFGI